VSEPGFIPQVDGDELRREKARARELRASGWWKRRVAEGICYYCRARVGARALTADHLVPLVRGGRSVRGNMVPSCKPCNNRKRAMLPWEWDEHLKRSCRASEE
jgi:5-methylcytosine-specific restriction endonuclease McrA